MAELLSLPNARLIGGPRLVLTPEALQDLTETAPGVTLVVRSGDQRILSFKGTVIKGWTGLYEVKLPE